ncbi:MAG: c-type cytochrome [Acidobacteriota bacterium]
MNRIQAILLALSALPLLAGASTTVDEAKTRGKAIYHNGSSPSGAEIVALVGETRTEIPAAVLPCSNCHGTDGRGGQQPGIAAADITWPVLSRPRPATPPQEVKPRPPYTGELLLRAITRGVDSAGRRLHIAMPRYRLTRRDASDLVTYLQHLGDETEIDTAAPARPTGSSP